MKPKINLRLCIAGNENLLPLFKECLKSYLKFFEIGELLIYTSQNIREKVEKIIDWVTYKISFYDIDKFYEENYSRFPQNVKDVLDYSKGKKYKPSSSLFYLRMRWIMDYYLIDGRKDFIISDIDVLIFENTKPITDWINSDYLLYAASPDDFPKYNIIMMEMMGKDFFKKVPQFNLGWLCIPKGIIIDINKVCKYLKYEIGSGVGEEVAMQIVLTKNNIKTKLLPRDMQIIGEPNNFKNKTLCHLGPYGLNLEILDEYIK